MRTMLDVARGERKQMSHEPCPLWRRLAALLYDLLIVVAIVMVVGLLCQLATGGRLIETGAHAVVPLWYQVLQGVVVAAYFVASWQRGGQTLGMRPWRIRVSRDDGGAISLQQAVIRVLVAAAPLLLLALEPAIGLRATLWAVLGAWVLWLAVALFDPRRRALHDLAAGTELRRID
ncbi:RDD family protein [Rhodanobacter sp. PCA2]|uniref:RDD family protein n=1 Tax=Rhodanobacter sp. PCA2 TaxID=2006117 RepID=UPI0015E65DB5|nr:RDD family protein [Rhodanobacter sp. PCA2]MBA2077738.1 transporter [Rhodanobacter sp. PCA2]